MVDIMLAGHFITRANRREKKPVELIEAIKSRKSIRGYKQIPVSEEILTEILEIATRAPSGQNTQPQEFTVLVARCWTI